MEGTNGAVEVVGLAKVPCSSAKELEACMAEANGLRTTSKTDANDTSSRWVSQCAGGGGGAWST